MQIFQERLIGELKRQKISQRKLAEKLGVTQGALWQWLHDGAPSLERFKQICETLNVSADYLLGLDIKTGGGYNFSQNPTD